MQAMGFDRILGGVCAPNGFLASGVSCGIKEEGRPDLAVLYSETPASAVGVFTTNELKAAPVLLSMERVATGTARALVVNSGNANAMTGPTGEADARAMTDALEEGLGIPRGSSLVASTGIIGEYLPIEKVLSGIDQAISELSPGGNTDAAKAIMTTDTYPKELALEMEIAGKVTRIGAMAKGSGMIAPHLATMIVVITTDLDLEAGKMRAWLEQAAEWSFNRITVDGDQSTNDTVFMFANGAAFPGGQELTREEEELFFRALCWLTANLAMALVADGEGATKLLRVVVNGARSDEEAVAVARAISNSNLVKCSFFGSLLNWGRIAAAAGSAGVPMDREKLEIYLGEHAVSKGGDMAEFDERDVKLILSRDEVEITLELGLGEGSAYFLTTDLSTDYVNINAERS